MRRHFEHQDIQRLLDDFPAFPTNIKCNQNGQHRINPVLLPQGDGQSAQNNRDAGDRIGKQVQIGLTDVQILFGAAP